MNRQAKEVLRAFLENSEEEDLAPVVWSMELPEAICGEIVQELVEVAMREELRICAAIVEELIDRATEAPEGGVTGVEALAETEQAVSPKGERGEGWKEFRGVMKKFRDAEGHHVSKKKLLVHEPISTRDGFTEVPPIRSHLFFFSCMGSTWLSCGRVSRCSSTNARST